MAYAYRLSEVCEILDEYHANEPANAAYGVPRGTIVAWHPSEEDIVYDPYTNEVKHIQAPNGWFLCDGTNAPNLVDHFILGVTQWEQVGKAGGSPWHTHPVDGTIQGPVSPWKGRDEETESRNWLDISRLPISLAISLQEASNLPPHVKLVYIMKG